jgi:hypothetical protein
MRGMGKFEIPTRDYITCTESDTLEDGVLGEGQLSPALVVRWPRYNPHRI